MQSSTSLYLTLETITEINNTCEKKKNFGDVILLCFQKFKKSDIKKIKELKVNSQKAARQVYFRDGSLLEEIKTVAESFDMNTSMFIEKMWRLYHA